MTVSESAIIKIASALLLLLVAGESLAQNTGQVTGRIAEESGEPIIGAVVRLNGGDTYAVTDAGGNYTIKAPKGSTLVYSVLGFKDITRTVDSSVINVVMSEDVNQIDDAVVIGYGYVRRVDLTGSVGSVNTDEMLMAPVRSFDEALGGRIAGVQVGSTEGEPGSDINIVIRGSNSLTQDNSPLYIVDGFPMENINASAINPSDIQSIDVLKDASSTAIYGARGANGVIVITTKSGMEGKPKISYEGKTGFQTSTNKMELMDPYEFVRLQYELDPYMATAQYLKPNSYGFNTRSLDYYKNVQYIDWQQRCLQVAPINDHTISISGGSKSIKYFGSLNYLQQKGIIVNSGYQRLSARLKLDISESKWFRFGTNINYSLTNRYGTSVRMPASNAEASLTQMYNMWGYRPVSGNQDIDNFLLSMEDLEIDQTYGNRFNPRLYLDNEDKNNKQNYLGLNAYFEFILSKYLRLRLSGGMNLTHTSTEDFFNSNHPYSRIIGGVKKGVNGYSDYTDSRNLLSENTLTYNRTFAQKFNVNAVLGVTFQKYDYSNFRGTAWNVPREELKISGLDEGEAQPLLSSKQSNTMNSGLFRLNFNYDRRYYLTFSMRADGSSKFPKGNRWGFFPSGAVSWRLSREPFMKNVKWLSDAKLRASYGVTGNNRVGNFDYLSQLSVTNVAGYAWNNTLTQGSYPNSLGNSKYRWESTRAFDAGIDLSFFNDRISIIADYYNKTTVDLLLRANLPVSSGYQTAMMNIGSVRNNGFEFTINTVNIAKKNFSWTSNLNISLNRSKVLALNDGQDVFESKINWHSSYGNIPLYETRVGEPITMFVGMEFDGLYQIDDFTWQYNSDPSIPHSDRKYVLKDGITDNGLARNQIKPGYIKFKDQNGDLHIDDSDRVVLGDPSPKFAGGFSNTFRFWDFDLNIFLQFNYGNLIMNANRILFEGTYRFGLNQFASYSDRWSPTNQGSLNPVPGGSTITYYSDKTLEDGSFLRLKTLSLGYTLPSSITKKCFFSELRVALAAQNLLTFSSYKGYDPEVSIFHTALTPGLDYLSYPRARTFTFSLNITF